MAVAAAASILTSCSTTLPTSPGRSVKKWADASAEQSAQERRWLAKYSPEIAEVPLRLIGLHDCPYKGRIMRPQHAKMLAGFSDASIRVADDLPEDLRTSWLQPGRRYRATVRFSNASGRWRASDSEKDLRGIAIRVHVSHEHHQDFLLTNALRHHARDARQALASVAATARGSKVGQLMYLTKEIGLFETLRIVTQVGRQSKVPVPNLASETFHCRGCYAVGEEAIRFRLAPDRAKPVGCETSEDLGATLVKTLKNGPVTYRLEIQRYRDPNATPIEKGDAVWDTPFEVRPLFVLMLPKGASSNPAVDCIRFSPFQMPPDRTIRPIGALNRVRAPVYHRVQQSQAGS